ncbi:MAG: hypothetical protein GXX91_11350 [Verrucomicrobiaceae bacterium]|nr:hypothetical protein [Verrucomicrobiaceae bacterium]
MKLPVPILSGLVLALLPLPIGLVGLVGSAGAEESPHPETSSGERVTDLQASYFFEREGTISARRTFRLRVEGEVFTRGPVLHFLTVFPGPAGLILDTGMEIDGVLRDGKPEPYRIEKGDGYLSLWIGSPEVTLEHREHTYTVTSRRRADWRQAGGEFFGGIDATGYLPHVPIDRAEVVVRLPEGVVPAKFSPAVTGFSEPAGTGDPGFETILRDNHMTVRTTRPLGDHHSVFLNLAWPSRTFASQSLWKEVLLQHPRIPLAAFSGVLLLWALVLLLLRAAGRRSRE